MRESWTDERLDDLSNRMDEGFRDVRSELRTQIGSVRTEIGSVREELRLLREDSNARLDSMAARLDGIQSSMIYAMISFTVAGLGGMIAVLATKL